MTGDHIWIKEALCGWLIPSVGVLLIPQSSSSSSLSYPFVPAHSSCGMSSLGTTNLMDRAWPGILEMSPALSNVTTI